MQHVQERGKVHIGFQWGNLWEGDQLKDRGVNGRIILKWTSEKWDGGHRLDRSGSGQAQESGSCECGNEPSGFHKMRGISCLAEDLSTFQVGLCSMESVSNLLVYILNSKPKRLASWHGRHVGMTGIKMCKGLQSYGIRTVS